MAGTRNPTPEEKVELSNAGFDLPAPSDRVDTNAQALRGARSLIQGGSQRYLGTSYSGADIKATIQVGDVVRTFAELQTISYSIHRELSPVRTLGRCLPKGYTKGEITIAGSLVFTVFDRHVFMDLFQNIEMGRDCLGSKRRAPLANQLPPFDVTITFTNEYGYQSSLRIHDVRIVDEGQTMSIEDMITENIMSYIASDITIMFSAEDNPYGEDVARYFNKAIFTNQKVSEQILDEQQDILRQIGEAQKEIVTVIPDLMLTDPVQATDRLKTLQKEIGALKLYLISLQEKGPSDILAFDMSHRTNDLHKVALANAKAIDPWKRGYSSSALLESRPRVIYRDQ